MSRTMLVIQEQDHTRLQGVLTRLLEETNAKFVFLLDKAGQAVASVGELDQDLTALASLTAGNVAATEGLGQLLGEDRFSTLFHEGENSSVHISLVSGRIILVVVFNETSSLGLVRLRVTQFTPELGAIVDEVLERGPGQPAEEGGASFDLSDEDIDALFS